MTLLLLSHCCLSVRLSVFHSDFSPTVLCGPSRNGSRYENAVITIRYSDYSRLSRPNHVLRPKCLPQTIMSKWGNWNFWRIRRTRTCDCNGWPSIVNIPKFTGVGAQSTLRGTKFLPEKCVLKSAKFPNFAWFLPEKLSKYQNFYDICPKNLQNSRILHDFARKNARILCNNCPKNIFSRILGGHVPPCPPPSPTPMPKFALHGVQSARFRSCWDNWSAENARYLCFCFC